MSDADRKSLTRDEAAERARLILPLDGDLAPAIQTVVHLDFTPDSGGRPDRFSSTTLLRFRCAEPGATTFIDLSSENVRSIRLNG